MTAYTPQRSPVGMALRCACPRCGDGPLFTGLLTLRERCPNCDMDYSRLNADDGAAFFIIVVYSAIMIPLAIWVEFRFAPPLWLHVVIWTPVVFGGSIAMMRPLKAWLLGQQYRHKVYDEGPGVGGPGAA